MNTNKLKSFAKEARIKLMEAAGRQLIYWGFNSKSEVEYPLEEVSGGYLFRGDTFDDSTIPAKWKRLKKQVTTGKEGFADAAESAAYTWFNRLTAIKILEENGFIPATISYVSGSKTPQILQRAKAGEVSINDSKLKKELQETLLDGNDEKAFGLLLINFCRTHAMLNRVFGQIDDYTEMLMPQNLLSANGFVDMLNDTDNIAPEDFSEVELIGWLYQFYIADRKDEVFAGFKKNKKARAEDIPAATQIFTPKWIVSYMVENTLGKTYLDYESDSDLREQMKYLVSSDSNESEFKIDDITQLTLIDPACGSGHILVTAFEWLFRMYREQFYSAENAVKSILTHNLYGLEIDDRAMQLSRFALLLKAALMLNKSAPRSARELINNPGEMLPKIYAFPENRNFISEEIGTLTDGKHVAEISKAFDLLREGKNLGSVIKLNLSDDALQTLQSSYDKWQKKSQEGTADLNEQELWSQLKAYFEIAITLGKKYSAVVANPPYMGQKSMNGELKDYINTHYPMTKSDLFAVFMEVCLNLNNKTGLMGMINQHSWMFLSSFENYRKHLLKNNNIQSMLHLGPRTFEELSGEVVQSTTFVLENRHDENAKGNYYRLVDYKSNREKEENFLAGNHFYPNIPQSNFEKIPGSPIAYFLTNKVVNVFNNKSLIEFADPKQGMATSDNNRFRRDWQEISIRKTSLSDGEKWFPYNSGGGFRKWYGNQFYMVNWENDGSELRNFKKAVIRSPQFYFKESISWSKIAAGGLGVRYFPKGFIFDVAGCSIFEKETGINLYLLGVLNSNLKKVLIETIAPTLNYEVGQISNVPIVKTERIDYISLIKENISLSKSDWDSREISWDFKENPLLAQQAASLQAAYNSWQEKVTDDFYQLHTNEEELNRIFIDIYGLQEELTPEVPLRDITILQDELKGDDLDAIEDAFRAGEQPELPIQRDIVMQQFISYLIGTMMGRYRLDKPGLHIAHPNPTDEELATYGVERAAIPFTMTIDDDAIVPLMGDACAFPDDAVKQVQNLVHKLWGDASQVENMNFINESLGMTLDKWMTEKFWVEHISGRMYKKKPIYWMFCSNPRFPHRSAFRVLVYMHRMDQFTVQNILRKYLHTHMGHIKSQYEELNARELELSRDEMKTSEVLQKQISELNEYEEKLKHYANLQISFDLDDGVDINYAKFEGVVAKI